MTRNPDEWFNHRASKWLPQLKRREYYADRTLMLIISLIFMSVTAVAEPLPQAKFGVFGLEFKDYFAIGTGSLSVLLSGLALYLTQFRKAKVSAQIGPAIHLYHPQDGGTAIYLPTIFLNTRPVNGAVFKAYLVVEGLDKQRFILKWLESANINIETRAYSRNSPSKPFTIDGHATIADVLWFLCPEQSNLRFRAGDYNVTLFIWTNTDEKPSAVTKEVLTITPFVETFLAERKEKKDSTTRIIYFQNKAHIASVTNKEPDWREF
jgi:hypothetical protein